MATIPYIIGESGTLGFPVNEYDGSPIDPTGLGCRLTIYQDGPDLHLIGTWESGPVDDGSGPITHPAIASFAATPETMPLHATAYPCGLAIDDGTGWRNIGNHIIDVRRP